MANDFDTASSRATEGRHLRTVLLALLPGLIAIAGGTMALASFDSKDSTAPAVVSAAQPAKLSTPAPFDNRFVPSSIDAKDVEPEAQPATF